MMVGLLAFGFDGNASAFDTLKVVRSFGTFTDAVGISADIEGDLYVLDRAAISSLFHYTQTGMLMKQTTLSDLIDPSGLDASLGNFIAVADRSSNAVVMYSRDLIPQFRYNGSDPLESRRFSSPSAVAMTPAGECTVLDGAGRILKLHPQTLEVHEISALRRYERTSGKIISYALSGTGTVTIVTASGWTAVLPAAASSLMQVELPIQVRKVIRSTNGFLYLALDGRSVVDVTNERMNLYYIDTPGAETVSVIKAGSSYYVLTATTIYQCTTKAK